MMASGKSSVGRRLATELACGFVDLDEAVEARTSLSVANIFAQHGEFNFRACEAQVLRDLPRQIGHGVVATGGGTPLHFDSMTFMRQSGTVVYLEATADTLTQRLAATRSTRPMLAVTDWRARVRELLDERAPFYEQAHTSYAVDDASVEEIALGLAQQLPQVTGH